MCRIMLIGLGSLTLLGCVPKSAPTDDAPPHVGAPTPAVASAVSATVGHACQTNDDCDPTQQCQRLCVDAPIAFREGDCKASEHAFCEPKYERRALRPEEFMFVLPGHAPGASRYGIIQRAADPLTLVDGPLTVHAADDDTLVLGRPTTSVQHDALRNRAFVLGNAAGQQCEATAAEFVLLGLEPRDPDLHADAAKVGDTAPPAWAQYAPPNGAVFVAVRFEDTDSCANATWARAADLPAPTLAAPSPVDDDERAQALQRYAALPAAEAHAARFIIEQGAARPGGWMDYREGGGTGPTVSAFTLGTERRIVVSTAVGDPCVGYTAQLMTSLAPVGTELQPTFVAWDRALQPTAALDLDGDGRAELIEHYGAKARLWSATLTAPGEYAPARASTGC